MPEDQQQPRSKPPVVIADYNPNWPLHFEKLKEPISKVLGPLAIAIEHVGSTSVPGLAAKPIIDLDIVIAGENDIPEAIRLLATIGYTHEGDLGITGREAFSTPPDTYKHHPYLVVEGYEPFTRHIAFRNRLRRDAEARAEYETLKRRLAHEHRHDSENYSYAKTEFVERVLAEELGENHRIGPVQHRRPS